MREESGLSLDEVPRASFLHEARSAAWQRWARAWNEVVHSLRARCARLEQVSAAWAATTSSLYAIVTPLVRFRRFVRKGAFKLSNLHARSVVANPVIYIAVAMLTLIVCTVGIPLRLIAEGGMMGETDPLPAFLPNKTKIGWELHDKDEVMTVPLDYCLSRRTATRLKHRKLAELLGGIRDDADLIAVFLLRELALGARSRWAEYIAVLPKPGAVSLPLFFSDGELRALHDMGERQVALEAQRAHVSVRMRAASTSASFCAS